MAGEVIASCGCRVKANWLADGEEHYVELPCLVCVMAEQRLLFDKTTRYQQAAIKAMHEVGFSNEIIAKDLNIEQDLVSEFISTLT